jgi:CRP-like cAMP-binding protein
VIGISAVIQKKKYPGSSRAFSKNSEVLKIYLRSALQSKNQDSQVIKELTLWVREKLLLHEQILRDKVDILAAGSTEQKTFELLMQLERRFGVKKSRLASVIPLPITKTQVSRLIESRVETVIRILSSWKKADLVSFEKNGIHISNWEALEKHANQEKV